MSRFIRIKNFLFPASEIRAVYIKDKTINIIHAKSYDANFLGEDDWRFRRNCSEIKFCSEGEALATFNYLTKDSYWH